MRFKSKAKSVVEKMTLLEKVGQLAQNFVGFEAYTRDENGEVLFLPGQIVEILERIKLKINTVKAV